MSLPAASSYVVIGAGIHGLSTAWHLARRLGDGAEVLVLDKGEIGAGASGIACGIVRNNYFQPAMRELMAHSVAMWESDPAAFSYHPVGYVQLSPEVMQADIASIHAQQRDIGYDSVLIEGAADCRAYMRGLFDDWQAEGITSVLHEKRGGYANNQASLAGLAQKAREAGARIATGVTVTGFASASGSPAVTSVETDQGAIECDQVVVAPGPWVRDFWTMLELPDAITVRDGVRDHADVPMWRFWQLEEGVLDLPPGEFRTNDGAVPPVLHVDTDAPLRSDRDGGVITDRLWGIYYKPDFGFGGIQGGAAPYPIDMPADEVAIDPYGPASPEFVASAAFAEMWCSALAFCHKRFEGQSGRFRNEPSGGLGCFTPDSFPVFDWFRDNVFVIADSNHGYKMIGVGALVAEAVIGGAMPALLRPFRFARFADGDLHPVSHSPFPWS